MLVVLNLTEPRQSIQFEMEGPHFLSKCFYVSVVSSFVGQTQHVLYHFGNIDIRPNVNV